MDNCFICFRASIVQSATHYTLDGRIDLSIPPPPPINKIVSNNIEFVRIRARPHLHVTMFTRTHKTTTQPLVQGVSRSVCTETPRPVWAWSRPPANLAPRLTLMIHLTGLWEEEGDTSAPPYPHYLFCGKLQYRCTVERRWKEWGREMTSTITCLKVTKPTPERASSTASGLARQYQGCFPQDCCYVNSRSVLSSSNRDSSYQLLLWLINLTMLNDIWRRLSGHFCP